MSHEAVLLHKVTPPSPRDHESGGIGCRGARLGGQTPVTVRAHFPLLESRGLGPMRSADLPPAVLWQVAASLLCFEE